jgi:Protein of unknown function (DUF669)
MSIVNFDARTVQPDEGRNGTPIPAGWYTCAMSKSELKPTKDGVNAMLATTFDVIEGPMKGRKVSFNFNLQHTNPQTVEIAYKQFSAVCHATGHLMVGDSQELHGRPLKLCLKVRPATMNPANPSEVQYEASNDITAFKNVADPAAVDAPKAAHVAPAAFTPPAAAAWTPPTVQPAPPMAPPAAWVPPTVQAAPPIAPPVAGPAPAWQPPAGAVAQPWAPQQPPAAAAPAPVAAPVAPPAGMAPAWQPPTAPAGVAPPWQQ